MFDQNIKFSLIICTLNRTNILKKCLHSISLSKYKNLEIIVVDQSQNSSTKALVLNELTLNIKYIYIEKKGLSNARNIAIKHSTGNYIALIDDDAYYDEYYFWEAYECIKRKMNSKLVYSGFIFDNLKNQPFCKYKSIKNRFKFNVIDVFKFAPSAGLIFPKTLFSECGYFDTMFGCGSYFGSSEETDLLLRALKRHYIVQYNENMKLNHPILQTSDYNSLYSVNYKKVASYAFGTGALIRKHICGRFFVPILYTFVLLSLKKLIKLLIHRRSEDYYVAISFIKGFVSYKKMVKTINHLY